jgi:hypothetical protein
MTVRNETSKTAQCEVWWILAHRSVTEPWEHPSVEAAPVPVALAAHQSRAIRFGALSVNDPSSGFFLLSGWVHCRSSVTGLWRHSDGATMSGLVEVAARSAGLKTLVEHGDQLWIQSVSIERSNNGVPTRLGVQVANGGTEPAVIDVASLLYPKGMPSGISRYTARKASTTESVAALGLTSINVSVKSQPPGDYRLFLELSEQGAASARLLDGVYDPRTVDVR